MLLLYLLPVGGYAQLNPLINQVKNKLSSCLEI